ncbi:MAG: pyridoxamine 5'-phosphate oxidase family protein [Clostridium sp.]
MRRVDREMDRDFALEVVDKCTYGVVSMVMTSGEPYCVPLSIVRVGENIYFHCALKGDKIDGFNNKSRVCISCVGDVIPSKNQFTTEFSSAIVKGNISLVEDREESIDALRALCLRYTPDNMGEFDHAIERSLGITAVYKVSIDEVTGKRKKFDSDGREMKFGRMK